MALAIAFGLALTDIETGDVPLYASIQLPLTYRLARTFNRPRTFSLSRTF